MSIPTSIPPGHELDGEPAVYVDWVEVSTLFSEEPLSKIDVRDFFIKENSFKCDGSADQMADDIWNELDRGSRLLQSAFPIIITYNRAFCKITLEKCPAHTFCLLVSYARSYSKWEKEFCANYQIQGELFACVTADALTHLLQVWDVERIG